MRQAEIRSPANAIKLPATLVCLLFSQRAVTFGTLLAANWPKISPRKDESDTRCLLFAPHELWQRFHSPLEITPYTILAEVISAYWPQSAFVFIGAAGIAVRAIAPFIRHKSLDAPVVVVDSRGRYVIPILSGHLGGANELARMIARHCKAYPVITTASDAEPEGFALDLALRDAGLRIQDWHELPRLQALLIEGGNVNLYDPCYRFRLPVFTGCECAKSPGITIHWQNRPVQAGIMRVVWPALHIGVGFRKDVSIIAIETAIMEALASLSAGLEAVASLATVIEKADVLKVLSQKLKKPLQIFGCGELSAVESPHPSRACGARFNKRPFSVCEAAALLAAGPAATLLAPKIIYNHEITVAIARETIREENRDE